MACKTPGRITNICILNIVRKFFSIVVFETSRGLLQDVYNEFTWLAHMSIFFFSWTNAVTHIGTFTLSQWKYPWLLSTEVWSPESQRCAHHLRGPSEMFFRVIAKPELCHTRISSHAFLPWKVECKAKERAKLVWNSQDPLQVHAFNRNTGMDWRYVCCVSPNLRSEPYLFSGQQQQCCLSKTSSPPTPLPCSNQLPKICFIVTSW